MPSRLGASITFTFGCGEVRKVRQVHGCRARVALQRSKSRFRRRRCYLLDCASQPAHRHGRRRRSPRSPAVPHVPAPRHQTSAARQRSGTMGRRHVHVCRRHPPPARFHRLRARRPPRLRRRRWHDTATERLPAARLNRSRRKETPAESLRVEAAEPNRGPARRRPASPCALLTRRHRGAAPSRRRARRRPHGAAEPQDAGGGRDGLAGRRSSTARRSPAPPLGRRPRQRDAARRPAGALRRRRLAARARADLSLRRRRRGRRGRRARVRGATLALDFARVLPGANGAVGRGTRTSDALPRSTPTPARRRADPDRRRRGRRGDPRRRGAPARRAASRPRAAASPTAGSHADADAPRRCGAARASAKSLLQKWCSRPRANARRPLLDALEADPSCCRRQRRSRRGPRRRDDRARAAAGCDATAIAHTIARGRRGRSACDADTGVEWTVKAYEATLPQGGLGAHRRSTAGGVGPKAVRTPARISPRERRGARGQSPEVTRRSATRADRDAAGAIPRTRRRRRLSESSDAAVTGLDGRTPGTRRSGVARRTSG